MNLFETVGFFVVTVLALLGASGFFYCTVLGARIAYRRLTEAEQKGPVGVIGLGQERRAN